jgi:hypothetical protein
MIRVFFPPNSLSNDPMALQNWLNGCLTECQGSGPGWERVAHLSQLVWRAAPWGYWVAVFETEMVPV